MWKKCHRVLSNDREAYSDAACILHCDDKPAATMRDPTGRVFALYTQITSCHWAAAQLADQMYHARNCSGRSVAESRRGSSSRSPRIIPKWVVAEDGSAAS
jgi:hypothetical protein